MAAIQARGIAPSLWKLEGVDAEGDAAAIVAQARAGAGGAEVGCLVLAGADDERLERWLSVAATTPGYIGFGIGRSIWRDPIRAHLAGELSARRPRRRSATAS